MHEYDEIINNPIDELREEEPMITVLDTGVEDIDFSITVDEHGNHFFVLEHEDKKLHLTVALQQWVRERAQEWKERLNDSDKAQSAKHTSPTVER